MKVWTLLPLLWAVVGTNATAEEVHIGFTGLVDQVDKTLADDFPVGTEIRGDIGVNLDVVWLIEGAITGRLRQWTVTSLSWGAGSYLRDHSSADGIGYMTRSDDEFLPVEVWNPLFVSPYYRVRTGDLSDGLLDGEGDHISLNWFTLDAAAPGGVSIDTDWPAPLPFEQYSLAHVGRLWFTAPSSEGTPRDAVVQFELTSLQVVSEPTTAAVWGVVAVLLLRLRQMKSRICIRGAVVVLFCVDRWRQRRGCGCDSSGFPGFFHRCRRRRRWRD